MDKWWFQIKGLGANEAEVLLYDEIGAWGITAAEFDAEMKALGPLKSLTLRINSPGGSTADGFAIYNILSRMKDRGTNITTIVDGVAASMASLIATVGNDVVMPSNTFLMLHNPFGAALGDSRDMKAAAVLLDKLAGVMASSYARKSGMPVEEVRTLMDEETWLTAAEAVAMGFADRIESPLQIAALFDLHRYGKAPLALNSGSAAQLKETSHMAGTQSSPQQQAQQETPEQMEARIRAEVTAKVQAEVKAKADADAAAAAAAKEETPEQMRKRLAAEARAEVQAEVAEINALCVLAGVPDKAAEFVTQGKSSAEVKAALLALKKTAGGEASQTNGKQQQQTPNAHLNAAGGQKDDGPKAMAIDYDAIYAKANGQKVAA